MYRKATKQEEKECPRLIHCGWGSMKLVGVDYFGKAYYVLQCLRCRQRLKVELLAKEEPAT